MKAIKLKLFTACMALLLCAFTASQAFGQTFTAIASGDWSSSATWVGEAPGTNESDVQIIIPEGIAVTLDSEVTLSGNLTVLDVDGELNSTANSSLTMSGGSITGSGSIILEELVLEGTAIVVFTGMLTTDVLESSVATLTLVADVVVNQALVLSEGILNLDTGGSMNLESDAVVEISGGSLALLGGTLNFSGNYNVIYSGNTSSETGIELSGEGLTDLTVDVGSGNTVTLNSDVDVAGTLSLESGTFELNGNDLEISGDVSATGDGELSASVPGSDLMVSTDGSVAGTLNFSSGVNQINNLTIELDSSGSVAISGNLDVEGNLTLQSGVLALNEAELTINGDLNGSGSFSADAGSDLTLNVDGGTTAGLNFEAGGQTIGDLTINIGDGNSIPLESDLTVEGNLHLETGNVIDISDVALTINGDLSGDGSLTVNAGSDLAIHVDGGTTAELDFGTGSQTIGGLSIDVGAGNSVDLNSDLTVEGTMNLESGSVLDITDQSLNLNGDLTGDGALNANAGSSLAVNAAGGTTAGLNFETGGQILGDLSIDAGSSNEVGLNSDLTVEGVVDLQSGVLALNEAELTINGDLTGSGSFSADAGSDLTLNVDGGTTAGLNFEAGGQTIGDLTINIGDGNSIPLESDLTVEGNLHLETGNVIDISDVDLTLNGDLTGDGAFNVNAGSALAIHADGGTTAELDLGAGSQTIGGLSIDVGAGNSVDLNSDLSVEGTLNLESGSVLDITDQTLNINGDLTGEGALNANAGSSLEVNAAGGTTAGLNFETGGQVLGDLSIDAGAGNEVGLNSDLTVEGVVDLQSGVLALNEAELTINGDLTGSGSFSADAGSDLTLNVDGGTTAGLNFEAGGQTIGDLTINIGDGNSIALESDLTVEGNLHLETGNVIDISDVELTLNGDLTGEGLFSANSETCLVVSTSQSVTAGLPFVTGGNTVGKLTIDIEGGGSANLENNLFVTTELNLDNGELALNGYNLDVSGDLSASGSASIHSTADSDLSLDLNSSPEGELGFSTGGNTVNDFTLNIEDGGSLALGSDLNVANELAFSGNGNISLDDTDLILSGDANISGSGSGSYVITAGDGNLVMTLESESEAQFPVGTEANFSPAIIELNPGSAGGQVMVRVATGVHSEGYTGIDLADDQNLVNATWFIDSDIDANLDMNTEVWWSADMEANDFNNSEVYLSHYFDGNWDMTATAEANQEAGGMWSINREGITSLSPFAVFDESTVVFVRDLASVELDIYPNPTAGKITVNGMDESIRDFKVTVYNATGQLMESHRFSDLNFVLNLDHFEEGNYFIRIHNDEVDLVRQVVKIKP